MTVPPQGISSITLFVEDLEALEEVLFGGVRDAGDV